VGVAQAGSTVSARGAGVSGGLVLVENVVDLGLELLDSSSHVDVWLWVVDWLIEEEFDV
jgi:hypothetical protein